MEIKKLSHQYISLCHLINFKVTCFLEKNPPPKLDDVEWRDKNGKKLDKLFPQIKDGTFTVSQIDKQKMN